MADHDTPFKLRVLIALTTALKEIVPAEDGPYRHDLSQAVFRGRDWFGDTDPIPMLSILENPEQPLQQVKRGRSMGDWELLLQGFVDDDPLNPTDPAHFLLADVKTRLGLLITPTDDGIPNILGMGPGGGQGNEITNMTFGTGTVRPPDAGISAKAYFWMPVTFSLVENLNNPFA